VLGRVVAAQSEEATGAAAAAETTVVVENPQPLEPFTGLTADELNVKTVEFTKDIDVYGRFELTLNARSPTAIEYSSQPRLTSSGPPAKPQRSTGRLGAASP
jgi:hypothetical protein